jgi:alkylation response protein AidB-like acyl-CoA dehydrogenase
VDFTQTDERRMLQETLQRFLQTTYSHERRREIIDSARVYDTELFSQLAKLGVLGALFSEDVGGFGGSGFDISTVFEELGRAGVIEPILGSALLAGNLFSHAADLTNNEHQTLLEDVMDGTTLLALAHGEPDSRYDLNQVSSRAQTEGDKTLISGTKTNVINGAQASYLLVSARESGADSDEAGISLFLVPIDSPGITCTGHMNVDGTAGATIKFENVNVPSSARLGTAGSAYTTIEAAVAHGILGVCAEAVGAMEASKQLTIEYLRERQQFGTPIGNFQALQHRLADLLIEIEQARSAVVNLAGNLHQPREIREPYVSAAKNLVGRVGTLVSEECIQMHGGIGMTNEYALSHFARRLVMIDHQFGDVDHHLERFIAWSTI